MSIIINLFFVFILHFINVNAYDVTQLNVGVWLSGAAYCDINEYDKMILNGPAMGFIYKHKMIDIKTDLQGYIGIIPSTESIYVVLRGTSSIINWLDDLEVKLVNYTSFPDCNCKVHYGFYKSVLGIKNMTIDYVKILKKEYPNYSVIVTGHSYGAATGQLLAMELVKENIKVKLYNYGQPRVGDKNYAMYVNKFLDEYYRTTHNKDLVVHLPPNNNFDYFHSCIEIYENESNILVTCSEENCEDPNCSNQYKIYQTNTYDHSYYLKHFLDCYSSIVNE